MWSKNTQTPNKIRSSRRRREKNKEKQTLRATRRRIVKKQD
jgi:hypothetical protein